MSIMGPGDVPVAAAPRPRRRRRAVRGAIVAVVSLAAFVGIGLGGWVALHGGSSAAACLPGARSSPAAPASVPVQVLNGTTQQGLATRTAASLSDRGFRVGGVGNAAPLHGATEVRYPPAAVAQAKLVAKQFPSVRLVVDRHLPTRVDVVLGSDFSRLRAVSHPSSRSHRAHSSTARKTTSAGPVPSASPSCH